jgi:hypothetical protein
VQAAAANATESADEPAKTEEALESDKPTQVEEPTSTDKLAVAEDPVLITEQPTEITESLDSQGTISEEPTQEPTTQDTEATQVSSHVPDTDKPVPETSSEEYVMVEASSLPPSDYDPRETSLSLQTETTYPLPTDTTVTLPTETSLSLPEGAKEALGYREDAATADDSHEKEVAIGAGVAGVAGVAAATALIAHNLSSSDEPGRTATVARLEEYATKLEESKLSKEALVEEVHKSETLPLGEPAEQARPTTAESSQVVVDKAVPLSESFHVVDKDTPAQEEAARGEDKKTASSEDGEESAERPAVAGVVDEEKTITDDGSLVASRPTTEGTGPQLQTGPGPGRPVVEEELALEIRVPTPGVDLPDLDDPVAKQLSRMRSLRRQRRNTIKQAEEMVAAAVVLYATAQALSPPGSPRLASPVPDAVGSPEMHSADVKGKLKEEVAMPVLSLQDPPAEGEQGRGRARSRDLPDPVTDLSVDKTREPLKAEDAKIAHSSSRRHSHHSSRHRSHRDGREGSKDDGSRRSHRSRADSYASVRSRGEDEPPPRTPNREDPGFSEHRSSPHSRRYHRTPEEQAAHERRKEERRRARELEKARDGAPSSPAKADRDNKDYSAPRDRDHDRSERDHERSERSERSSHSHLRRSSRRHSHSHTSMEPPASKMELPPPSPTASKKFFDIKNGKSVLEVNFGSPSTRESALPLPIPLPSASSSSKAVIPPPPPASSGGGERELLRRSSTARSMGKVRRSEDRIPRKEDDWPTAAAPATATKSSRDRDRDRDRDREREHRPKVSSTTTAGPSSMGEAETARGSGSSSGGDGSDAHAAHRAKRLEKREKAREKEQSKGGLKGVFKKLFGGSG